MAILPTKNELKEVSLEALETYKEFLEEEITVRRRSEKERTAKEIAESLEKIFKLAERNDINIFFEDEEQTLHLDDFIATAICGGSVSVIFG